MFSKMFRNPVVLVVLGAIVGVIVLCAVYYAGTVLGVLPPLSSPDQAQPPQFQRMELQAQYAGPLASTVIQRWRDPVDGTICYVYLPMVVKHTSAPSGYLQYGNNSIGSISCLPGPK